MARAVPSEVSIAEGPAFMELTEDGFQPTWHVTVHATVGGNDYRLTGVVFRPSHRLLAEQLVARIVAAGAIDLDRWTLLEPRMSLEDRWALYAQAEDEARHGYRSEDDLYHGID